MFVVLLCWKWLIRLKLGISTNKIIGLFLQLQGDSIFLWQLSFTMNSSWFEAFHALDNISDNFLFQNERSFYCLMNLLGRPVFSVVLLPHMSSKGLYCPSGWGSGSGNSCSSLNTSSGSLVGLQIPFWNGTSTYFLIHRRVLVRNTTVIQKLS